MRYIVTAIRCLGMLIIGAIILCLMGLCDLFCGAPAPLPTKMRIVGWNCNEIIYEDSRGRTFERSENGHFVAVGK